VNALFRGNLLVNSSFSFLHFFPGTSCVFLLVPLTLASTRRFALFGGGGDFTRQVEVAQDLGESKLVSAYFQGLLPTIF